MKILLIEDEIDIRAFLKKNLEMECFSVDMAADGEEGCLLAENGNHDLIILDNMLPKKTGKEICRQLRAQKKHTPILMLSVKSDVNTKVDLLNAGADDYLIKPFSFDELLARVHALFRRPKVILSEVISLGDITLDAFKHKVSRAGQVVILTKKEFMLLEYFMRNPGTVLSRGMIMEHVWDMNADPFSNTIESHILSLRKKIELENSEKCIITVPGRGYKFEFMN
jgi:DNA-binding response OmpR family regulator